MHLVYSEVFHEHTKQYANFKSNLNILSTFSVLNINMYICKYKFYVYVTKYGYK